MINSKSIVGITGLFCSGKSTLEKILIENYGYNVIDLDKIGHIALEEKNDEIVKEFGKNILTDNKIDRKKLGSIVFKDKNKLNILNNIVWPFMKKYVEDKINNSPPNEKICISGAVLFEIGLYSICSKIFVVKANIFNILKRAKIRNNYSLCKTFSILSKQKVIKLSKKNKKNTEIIYVNNNFSIERLKEFINSKID